MKFINESIYWHETGRICNYGNGLLHEVLGWAPAIILAVFLFKVKNLFIVGRITPRIIPYFIIE
jgi:hypothetical protein